MMFRRKAPDLPLRGEWPKGRELPLIDRLDDAQLAELNEILRWNCFIVDGHGRRFGNAANAAKRNTPQEIPDRRVVMLDERFRLAGKHVVEIGCFEGIHTIALAERAGRVTAVDARVENVVKAIVRTSLCGQRATILVADVERYPLPSEFAGCDVMFHVGVLYHLRDPVAHLRAICAIAKEGLALDTHIALPEQATETYDVGGEPVRYLRYREGGPREVFSGVYDHAKWLTLETIEHELRSGGFARVEVAERRDERNGPRVLIFASRS
jgi:tRNA (mo5U34)-methyltransferase